MRGPVGELRLETRWLRRKKKLGRKLEKQVDAMAENVQGEPKGVGRCNIRHVSI